MSKNILIIDQDNAIASALVLSFEIVGYACVHHRKLFSAKSDWLKADLVIWHVKKDQSTFDLPMLLALKNVPVMMVGDGCTVTDKVRWLDSGAIDFLDCPFSGLEMYARVKAHLRKFSKDREVRYQVEFSDVGFSINRVTWETWYKGDRYHLSKKAFELLFFLSLNIGKVFSRSELLEKVWGYSCSLNTRTVDTHILRLREYFPDIGIETIYGVGYCIKR